MENRLSHTEILKKNIEYLCRARGVSKELLEAKGGDVLEGVTRHWLIEAICDTSDFFDIPVEILLYGDIETMGDIDMEKARPACDTDFINEELTDAIATVGEIINEYAFNGNRDGVLNAAQTLAELVMARAEINAETVFE